MPEPFLENCEFGNWYPLFKKYVPKARVLYAPEDFREYLLSDGIVLHEDNQSDSDSEWETADVPPRESHESGSDEEVDPARMPPKEFHDLIERTIKDLNGEVVPKLNWSTPVDSKWINPSNSLKCTSANDVYMLLKSSDYVNHDLELKPNRVSLVLREWFDLHPSSEFRCFVKERSLIGITQRDMNYYEFLEPAKSAIERLCKELSQIVNEKFADSSFVFDVYIPTGAFDKAWLIDINPWHEQTDTLLFTWDELRSKTELEIRLIEKADRSRTFSAKPHSTSHVPYDFVDMEKGTLEDMLKQMKEQREKENQTS